MIEVIVPFELFYPAVITLNFPDGEVVKGSVVSCVREDDGWHAKIETDEATDKLADPVQE